MPVVASFVIYYHSSRMDNLEQTLRFLSKRDAAIMPVSELVLVCQDESETPPNTFSKVKQINLGRDSYNKPLMNNIGVREAEGDIIVLLDSDRILPYGYFTQALCSVQPKQCISTVDLHKLQRPATDEEIEHQFVPLKLDHRTIVNEMHMKNMFSGNTVMKRQDYLDAGGMDESFEGYGYNDTDFTQTMTQWGAQYIWWDKRELHLWHPPGLEGDDMIRSNVMNGVRYCNKWNLKPGPILTKRAADIGIDLSEHIKKMKKYKLLM